MSALGVEALLDVQRRSYERAGPGLSSSWPQEDALDGEQLAVLLDELHYAVLATARPDGRPHASPIAYSFEGGAFWIATVEGLRLRNLRTTPWASIVVAEGQGEGSHRALTAEGPATLHEGAAFQEARTRLDGRWRERHAHPPDWAVAFAEVRPERVFSHWSRPA